MELGLRETKEFITCIPRGETDCDSIILEAHIQKSSREVREWKVIHDLMFCPSAVVLGSFIKTSITCSQTGGIEGGSGGVIRVGMLEGGLAGGVEASGWGVGPKGMSGDTKPLGGGGGGHDGGW